MIFADTTGELVFSILDQGSQVFAKMAIYVLYYDIGKIRHMSPKRDFEPFCRKWVLLSRSEKRNRKNIFKKNKNTDNKKKNEPLGKYRFNDTNA